VALARQLLRDRIDARLASHSGASLVAALVVGDQNAIDQADWDVFRATGVAHLVSISGLHITMFAWGAALLTAWLWRRSVRLCRAWPAPSAGLMGGVALATAYAVFSGWGVPAQRTCLMLATVSGLRLCGARWPAAYVWLLAAALVVVADPWALLQAGFWLSFVAVGVLFAGGSPQWPANRPAWQSRLMALAREQWIITLALAPLTLLLFGQVSLIGMVANALAIPLVTLVLTPLSMAGVVLPVLWVGAAGVADVFMTTLRWLAALPWATLSFGMPPLWVAFAGVAGAGLLILPWPWRLRLLALPLLVPVLFWRAPLPAPGEFELLAADVGQGNAVLLRTASHALLYDAGPRYSLESDAGHRVLVPLLQALHTTLDDIILSHRDTDHIGGAPAVLATQPQAGLLSSVGVDHPLQQLRPVQPCQMGAHWQWDGVEFEILHPQSADYAAVRRPNAMSCVLRVWNSRQAALLVGDIELEQEQALLQRGAALNAQVLLVPHHGSKTSSSAAFLDAVAPAIALVQSGYRNRFGHPNSAVLERYRERGVRVFDSPHCGAMTWQSWNPQFVACERTLGLRYWHHRVP
jgi:competence protein ComEC